MSRPMPAQIAPETYSNTGMDKEIPPLTDSDLHLTTTVEQYNLNFNSPIKVLESDLVRLEPFIPSIHGAALYAELSTPECASIYFYRSAKQPKSLDEFLRDMEKRRRDSGNANFVIFDKTKPEGSNLAGYTGYSSASDYRMTINLGFVGILPKYQRTHVQTHSSCLLIRYALTPKPDGLGVRNITWQAFDNNVASKNAGLRLGFKYCGTMRKFYIVTKPAPTLPPVGTPIDKWMAQITIEDWNSGFEKHLDALMTSRELSALPSQSGVRVSNTYLNKVQEEETSHDLHLETPPAAYDLNFCYEIPGLENEMVVLEPLIPSLHARAVWEAISTAENVHVLDYFFCIKPGPLEELLQFVEKTRADTGQLLMVVFDKVTDPGQKRFAGLVCLYDAESHKFLELGPVLILPEFQRTHVHTHAVGLVLQHCLEARKPALGLDCVRWSCHHMNKASYAAAKRLGFLQDALIKYAVPMSPGRIGQPVPGSNRGTRHDIWLSITQDDWVNGVARRIAVLMQRKPQPTNCT